MTWDDVRFDAAVPFVRVRVLCAKNKKEEHVPLIPEIREALEKHRPANFAPDDLVFPNGVPRASRLKADLERNGIAYLDESGRYGDFHALRYTFATFLQRHGIAQRFAMKLMRHSDIKLTSKVYTDETQLPIYDAIKVLPRLMDHTQIRAQILVAEGLNGSLPVAKCEENVLLQVLQNKAFSPFLTPPVVGRRMERAKRFELSTSSLARKCSTTELRPHFLQSQSMDGKGSSARRFFQNNDSAVSLGNEYGNLPCKKVGSTPSQIHFLLNRCQQPSHPYTQT